MSEASEALKVLDAAVKPAAVERVRLHRERAAKPPAVTVAEYKAGLKACRDVEDLLEPLRREHGATHSLRFDLTELDTEREPK